jgi:hypothetical protein
MNMALRLYAACPDAACPDATDVFDTGWCDSKAEQLSELHDGVYLIQCGRCNKVHSYRRNQLFGMQLPYEEEPEAQPAATRNQKRRPQQRS